MRFLPSINISVHKFVHSSLIFGEDFFNKKLRIYTLLRSVNVDLSLS